MLKRPRCRFGVVTVRRVEQVLGFCGVLVCEHDLVTAVVLARGIAEKEPHWIRRKVDIEQLLKTLLAVTIC